ncbi:MULTISPECIES: hypothetical protein [Vibrionaceae]|uniref:hypothetical protein n=1 Tax=Vibrionaceae TaxID=641 RepID=UPI00354C80A5
MGNYTEHLKQRISTRGPKEGYCSICRNFAKLTKEHVPPAGCGNISKVTVRTLMQDGANKKLSTQSQGGLNYKSTCAKCNNEWLGQKYDPAIVDLYNDIKVMAESVAKGTLSLPKFKTYFVKPQRIARSIIGHLIAANSIELVNEFSEHPPMYQAMADYFFDENAPLPENINIYYWFYPNNDIRVARAIGSRFGNGHTIVGDLLKFFPLAFWVVWDQDDSIQLPLNKLLPNKQLGINDLAQMTVNFDSYPELSFPEAPQENGMTIYNSKMFAVGTK